jgi:hypothetical protein
LAGVEFGCALPFGAGVVELGGVGAGVAAVLAAGVASELAGFFERLAFFVEGAESLPVLLFEASAVVAASDDDFFDRLDFFVPLADASSVLFAVSVPDFFDRLFFADPVLALASSPFVEADSAFSEDAFLDRLVFLLVLADASPEPLEASAVSDFFDLLFLDEADEESAADLELSASFFFDLVVFLVLESDSSALWAVFFFFFFALVVESV